MRLLLFMVIVLLLPPVAFADEPDVIEVSPVLISKHDTLNATVSLRWAPTDPIGWELANRHGWWLQRVLLPRGDAPGDTAYVMLTDDPMKPMPLEDWEGPSEASDWAATAAQVLYGETLDVSSPDNAMDMVYKSREADMRFSFGLTAAEQDFEVARMMGLGYVDTNLLPGRTYIYRVYANVPDTLARIDTAGVVVNLSRPYELPLVFDLEAEVKDTTISLSWPAGYHKGVYSSYVIGKKTKGKPWAEISSLPLANLFNEGASEFVHHYTDNHPVDGDTLFYRVRGRTPFGNYGPVSEEIQVVIPLLYPAPQGLRYTETPGGDLMVQWEFPAEKEEKITRFTLEGAVAYDDPRKVLASHGPVDRAGRIVLPASEMYITVVARGVDGSKRAAYPMLVQLADSIPPAPPVNLQGNIDSTGLVTVQWQLGTEPDLFGYRLYATPDPRGEYTLVTPDFVRDTLFQWQQGLNTLSSHLYVKAMAYDYRYNYSGFSDTLRLALPDTIPPTAPVLHRCEKDQQGILFHWVPSASPDVVSHALWARQEESDTAQVLIQSFDGNQTHYRWDDPPAGQWYFHVEATDHAGNTARSRQYFVHEITNDPASLTPQLRATKNLQEGQILLQWDTPPPGYTVVIYRGENGQNPITLHTLTGASYPDTAVEVGNKYSYIIRYRCPEGRFSEFSEDVVVVY